MLYPLRKLHRRWTLSLCIYGLVVHISAATPEEVEQQQKHYIASCEAELAKQAAAKHVNAQVYIGQNQNYMFQCVMERNHAPPETSS